jgi:L-asparaginase
MNTVPTFPVAASSAARIVVLATGGTIAGAGRDASRTAEYQAGVLPVDALLDSVPALGALACIESEQVFALDSKDMEPQRWLALARRVDATLAREEVAGVVITHGTDTLEETAYFLHLCVKRRKPVVLTAAMRPATALSADGPLNLYNAVRVAVEPAAASPGVLVVVNGRIHGARDVAKVDTASVDAFASPDAGPLGWVQDSQVELLRMPCRAHTLDTSFHASAYATLPEVAIVPSYAGVSRVAIDALVAAGVRGLVVAGTGNGSMHVTLQQALAEAAARGVAVVRASRVGRGHVMRNAAAPDDALGFVAAGTLSPYKARVLLMLALAAPHPPDAAALQAQFDRF